jgi:hypothetical protein
MENKKTPKKPVLERVWLLARDKEVTPAIHEIVVYICTPLVTFNEDDMPHALPRLIRFGPG